ncbi:hypothetical protein TCAL_07455 [Tigriopus californicus]|uniref:Uncharacterized protein n=1 Tax=Tigriopus californicus TaxID=6832 RepID=A0A553N762_TIGCA|nr:hypothetical protein TCAL_07455 [Tigriopus californicus]|eukprot:TCALIF_07455-PA protein Name:"Similar to ANKRD12 Ankyrin repeat domain-containing protein 12 (Homo sapiens)" AED:0.02 eAED:0.02 QI:303/0.8/0.66/1/0.6/0.83/6/181/875
MDRTPMSERQQLALIKQLEKSTGGASDDGFQHTSPSRTPLQVVNNANCNNSPLPSNQIGTPLQGSSPMSISPGTAESSPKTPLEDRIQRRLYRRNGKGETQLHRGAIKGNLMQCKKLLNLGIDPNVTDNAACNRGSEPIVRLLLRNGANINVLGGVGEQRETPLHDAARNGHIAVVKLLVSNGANLAAKRENSGQTPLDEAKNSRTKNPHIHEVIQYLTERQENSNSQIEQPEQTPSDTESVSEEVDIIKDFTPLDSLPVAAESSIDFERTELSTKSVILTMEEKPPNHEANHVTNPSSNPNAPEVQASTAHSTSTPGPTTPKAEDVYEFKGGNNKEIGASSNTEVAPGSETKKENLAASSSLGSVAPPPVKDDNKSKSEKRSSEVSYDDEEEAKRKKRKEEVNAGSMSKVSGRGTRGNSAEKSTGMKPGGKGRLLNADRKSPNSFPNSAANSPKKINEQSDSDDDNNSKKSTDSSGLKVPPLKIVLSGSTGNNRGNNSSGNSPGSSAQALAQEQADKNSRGICNKPYVVREEEDTSKGDDKSSEGNQGGASSKGGKDDEGNGKGSGSRMTRSRANQGTPGPDSNDVQGNSSESSSTSAQETGGAQSTSEYHVRKRKLRSQVEDGANSHQAGGSGASGNSKTNEPLNDIEKYLNIRKAIEQRRKNCFPVQPKPPQGYEDYLMNRKTYLLQGNANARLASMPKLKPPPSLKGELAELFKKQEEERYKLRCQHIVEKEKLVLNVEYEILRTHGRAARALANQSHPFSVCTMLKDEEIYNTIDPRQDEEKRDIRSRYNGRLFLSWCQDVDDKWEKIKEQVVLRHHNEAESLNAVQKCDWHDKVCEMKGVNPDDVPIQIDDLVIPMVHVSDDFDLSDSR